MKRNSNVEIRFTTEEKQKLIERANQLGLTLSAYIRFICLNASLVIEK